MSSHVRILGIAGSLRRGSYNQAALRAAELLVPENGEIDLFQLDEIPMFNEGDEKRPPSFSGGTQKAHRRADAVRHPQGFAGPKQRGDVDGSFGCNADAHLAALFICADEKNGKTEIPAICGQASSSFLD
jgi:hypothetical protein